MNLTSGIDQIRRDAVQKKITCIDSEVANQKHLLNRLINLLIVRSINQRYHQSIFVGMQLLAWMQASNLTENTRLKLLIAASQSLMLRPNIVGCFWMIISSLDVEPELL
jgi:hypothetical protein